MTKRYVTRQYLWNTFYTWGVWDKKECKWIVNDRLYRRNVIEIADKLNKEEQKVLTNPKTRAIINTSNEGSRNNEEGNHLH